MTYVTDQIVYIEYENTCFYIYNYVNSCIFCTVFNWPWDEIWFE